MYISKVTIAKKYIEVNGICPDCNTKMILKTLPLPNPYDEGEEYKRISEINKTVISIDHIIPKSRGGSNNNKNLRAICIQCNRIKGNKVA